MPNNYTHLFTITSPLSLSIFLTHTTPNTHSHPYLSKSSFSPTHKPHRRILHSHTTNSHHNSPRYSSQTCTNHFLAPTPHTILYTNTLHHSRAHTLEIYTSKHQSHQLLSTYTLLHILTYTYTCNFVLKLPNTLLSPLLSTSPAKMLFPSHPPCVISKSTSFLLLSFCVFFHSILLKSVDTKRKRF